MNYEYALDRAIGHLFNNYKKDDNIPEFAVVVCDIFRYAENKEELIITTLHDYGVGTKILNNKWCDLTDVIQLCYPEYNWEDIPKNFDELLEWQQKNNIVEWDHEFDDIDYYIDPKQINGYPYFVLVGTSENNLRILEIPDDKVDLMKQFVVDNDLTDLKYNNISSSTDDIVIDIYTEDPTLNEMSNYLSSKPCYKQDVLKFFKVNNISDIGEAKLKDYFINHENLWKGLQQYLIDLHPEDIAERKRVIKENRDLELHSKKRR